MSWNEKNGRRGCRKTSYLKPDFELGEWLSQRLSRAIKT